ncbi:MAG: biotin carboxylase N-terminal domain-containing protein, partial [Myxococcota bacterium]
MHRALKISRLLIANRGEIAVRVMRTCREMGVATVAVFSDADSDAPHVTAADEAVRIGPAAAAESYLDIARIVDAARRSGADAVHPGYGFLAENGDFAAACAEHGLIFIGPSATVIRQLGSKREAKRIAAAAGVPTIPGFTIAGADETASSDETSDHRATATVAERAQELGYPVLVKASAGGGGKGMRVVREPEQLDAAIASARREAKSAFGDDTLLIEKYIDRPRHIEIQILGDSSGEVIHLFERECSVQRRHQKIIEETPSPAVSAALRAEMGAAAVALGRAVGYCNAGTVEFILAPDGQFYVLEVNTRLQVEHLITECITGVDLVRAQIRVARGESLDMALGRAAGSSEADRVQATGAAIECRLYAEDPDNGFLPTTG